MQAYSLGQRQRDCYGSITARSGSNLAVRGAMIKKGLEARSNRTTVEQTML
jgi:hypothetical protein